jgi:hypothetical protein
MITMFTKHETMVSQKEIDAVKADFGSMPRLDVVRYGLLKCACGYDQGYTAKRILQDLKLISERYNLTKRGWYCLYEFFKGDSNKALKEKCGCRS